MKPIVCVRSCLKDLERGSHDVIRGTWGNALRAHGISVKFFVGQSEDKRRVYRFQADETMLDAKDDLPSLSYKVRSICRWATSKLVGHLYICDVDTFIYANNFAKFNYELYDYAGLMLGNDEPGAVYRYVAKNVGGTGVDEVHDNCYQWASGGNGYFLSQAAFDEVSGASVTSVCDDLWVGQVLGPFVAKHEIKSANIPKGQISRHYPIRDYDNAPYDPKCGWMQKLQAEQ